MKRIDDELSMTFDGQKFYNEVMNLRLLCKTIYIIRKKCQE